MFYLFIHMVTEAIVCIPVCFRVNSCSSRVCLLSLSYDFSHFRLGIDEGSQGLNPESCSARPQVKDRGNSLDGGKRLLCYIKDSLTVDHNK